MQVSTGVTFSDRLPTIIPSPYLPCFDFFRNDYYNRTSLFVCLFSSPMDYNVSKDSLSLCLVSI